MHDSDEVKRKLAGSLTAETTELIPYLPDLLQDIYLLGSSPDDMIRLIRQHVPLTGETTAIDLGCGKGAVSIALAKELGISVKGIDLLPKFIQEARNKAAELQITHLCSFEVQDINQSVTQEHGYDIVILGAVGDVLGTPAETLRKLKQVVRPGGHILIDDAYLSGDPEDIRYQNYEYLTLDQWENIFIQTGLRLIVTDRTAIDRDEEFNDYNNKMIRQRAMELAEKYPDKRDIFYGYVKSQQAECDDLFCDITGVTWLLKA